MHHPKVLVIGAGVSGLACARELTHRGYQVLIVEARDRVGGRLHSIPLAAANNSNSNSCSKQKEVDVGGALIHGIQHNPIYALTQQMGVTTRVVQECLLVDGSIHGTTPIDTKRDQTVAEQFNACLEQTFDYIQTQQQTQQESSSSLGSSSSSSFGKVFDRFASPLSPCQKEDALFKWHQANLELSCGAPLDQLGYQWNDDEPYGYDGSHVSVNGGWKQVMEGLSEGLNIMYSSPIQQIKVVHDETFSRLRRSKRQQRRSCTRINNNDNTNNNNTCAWESKTNGDKVHVTLVNGKVLEAHAVVCTLPLGILKLKHNDNVADGAGAGGGVKFDPPLSREKQQSIQKLGCGLLNKCVIQFPYSFWSNDQDFLGIIAQQQQQQQQENMCSSWPHLILCGQEEDSTLIFMFGGAYASQVEELSDVKVMEMCMSVLQKMYSTVSSSSSSLPCSPLDYHVTRWSQDVYARGAFVYMPPSCTLDDLEILSVPIMNDESSDTPMPLVCFAGEHTTPFHPSTIHGAFNSGIREAYRLDLSYFSELYNNQLQFEPKAQVYKKTFYVKRNLMVPMDIASNNNTYTSTNNDKVGECAKRRQRTTATTTTTMTRIPSPTKRRGRGTMTLRKRPRMNNGSTTHYSKPKEPKRSLLTNGHVPIPPSRRSDRVRGIPASPVIMQPSTTTTIGYTSQQDRSLVRSYESCRNWQLVQTKVLPVFGNDCKPKDENKNIQTEIQQLQARYQELREKKPRLDPAIVNEWLVAVVPPSCSKREMSERANDGKMHTSNWQQQQRKSRRPKKTRVVVNV
jgi:lysine-specific histone demethylase 1